jgi:CheY-like chemotaxis protein
VLVAEDEPVSRHLLLHQITQLGYRCDLACDGAQALRMLRHTRYDVLLTDCQMPKLSGYQLAAQVRAQEPCGVRPMPIIGMSASVSPENVRACREAGMDYCLEKPPCAHALGRLLLRWCHGGASRLPEPPRQPMRRERAEQVPLDIPALINAWGDARSVQQVLTIFVATFRADLLTLRDRVHARDIDALREWLHRAVGAASVLRHAPLLDMLDSLKYSLRTRPYAYFRHDAAHFCKECAQLLGYIEQQAYGLG